jgi:opacity protein-like surface antigen
MRWPGVRPNLSKLLQKLRPNTRYLPRENPGVLKYDSYCSFVNKSKTPDLNPDPVKYSKLFILFIYLLTGKSVRAQEQDKAATLTLFTGTINYQGDLNPNSFSFKHSNFATGIFVRKPLNRWFALRAGVNLGKIEAADRWNKEYLQSRNLSFTSSIKELYAGLELAVLDISTSRFTPYVYGGIALFHFNPWTLDNNGAKTYLKPLSTEGQGLSQYPKQRPYKLTQFSLPFGIGAKYAVSDGFNIGVEFSQRKTFTDYIDDVSTHFVDHDILLQARGQKAVDLAYRGDEVPGGIQSFPVHGEQRGTPSEMDWYYFVGLTFEMKLGSIGGLLTSFKGNNNTASQRCPRNVSGY